MRHKTALNLIPRLVMEIVLELCLCVCFFLFLFLRKQCLELDSLPIEAKGPVSKSQILLRHSIIVHCGEW